MTTKILQGLNFESTYSIVKIECDVVPDTRLLDLVRSYHPIFLKSYSVDQNTIIIETKLPQLWRESALALNKLSKGEWDYEQAKEQILSHVIKNQIYSMSTILVLEAAHELGFETTQIFYREDLSSQNNGESSHWDRYYRIGVGRNSGISYSAGTNKDSMVAIKTQRDKKMTNLLVTMLSLPIAKWEIINSEEDLDEIFDKYEKPVVIKPTGLTQGNGVTTNIYDIEHARKAYNYANEMLNTKLRPTWQKGIMIQKQVKGDDYRLLVIDGKLAVATKRVPAFVVGDGKSTIRELIDLTNTNPRRDLSNPAHILKPIQFDKPLDEFLGEQGRTLDDVLQKDEKLFVRKVASMSQGGITEDFTNKVHPHIKYIAESVASSIHANVVGIDVICLDISQPLTEDNGSFIEMNTMPEIYLNAYPVIGDQHEEIGKKIVNAIIKNTEKVRKIVAVGKDLSELNEFLINNGYFNDDSRVGVLSDGVIYINREKITDKNKMIHNCVQSLKLNASLSTIVLHYKDFDEIRELGFGFDSIDLLITDKVCEKVDEYKNNGLIDQIANWN